MFSLLPIPSTSERLRQVIIHEKQDLGHCKVANDLTCFSSEGFARRDQASVSQFRILILKDGDREWRDDCV